MIYAAQKPRRLRRSRGYALVVTLGLLVLSATVMVGVSRAALGHVNQARRAAEDLQRHHGAASIRAAVLPRAESFLAIAEAERSRVLPSIRQLLRLGSCSFEIVISDEQAKANVNRMLVDADATSVQTRLREVLSGTGLGRAVELRAAATESEAPPITGVGQVFNLPGISPEQLINPSRFGPAPLDLLTIWGDGRLNLRRASLQSARLALQPPLTAIEVGRLTGAQRSTSSFFGEGIRDPLQRLLDTAGVQHATEGQTLPVTLASTCHSVWVITDDGRRKWHEVEVLDRSEPEQPKRAFFSW